MKKYPFDKSLENVLAEKAEEFSLKPSKSVWQGIESGMQTPASGIGFKALFYASSFLTLLGLSYLLPQDKVQPQLAPSNFDVAASTKDLSLPNKIKKATVILVKDQPIRAAASEEPRAWPTSFEHIDQPQPIDNHLTAELGTLEKTRKVELTAAKPNPIRTLDNPVGRWAIKGNYSGSYSYRALKAKNAHLAYMQNHKNHIDQPLMGHHADIGAKYYMTNGLALEFGLGYTSWGERIGVFSPQLSNYYDSTARDQGYNPKEIYKPGSDNYRVNRYHQIELPVILSKEVKRLGGPYSPFKLSAQFGVALSYSFGQQYISYDKEIDHFAFNSQGLRRWNLQFMGGLKFDYHMNEQLAISTGPNFRYAMLSSLRDANPFSQKQYALGWSVGFQWNLLRSENGR